MIFQREGRVLNLGIKKFLHQLHRSLRNITIISISEEEEIKAKEVAIKVDAETQTDPEITGVDADDFEEDDGEESGSDSSDDEDDELEAGEDGLIKSVDKGTSSKPVRRKIIELKYYFGEDLPDAELNKRKIVNFSQAEHMVALHKLVD